MKPSVGVAIVTFRARQHLPRCLPPVLAARIVERVLIVDSSSDDGSAELARQLGAEVLVIPQREFNHGSTRERARQHLGTDIAVMMTQDAYLTEPAALERLIEPVADGTAALAYARQIAHDGADILEAFSRRFNYSADSQIKSIDDLKRDGVFTYFCSNTCAAYASRALDEIGGFRPVLTAEDTLAAAMLLRRGHRIAYVADSVVKHSHKYSLKQEFRRYFDTGYMRRLHREWLTAAESDEDRGRRFVGDLIRELRREQPGLIPYALAQSVARLAGYKIGRVGMKLPVRLRRVLSAQDYYWNSAVFEQLGV